VTEVTVVVDVSDRAGSGAGAGARRPRQARQTSAPAGLEQRWPHTRTDLIAQLSAGVAELTTSVAWQRHLQMQARMRHYSFGNVVLIAIQRPDATAVAGFRAWQQMDRQVRAGERAIWILAPMSCSRGGAASLVRAEGGEEERFITCRPVAVFDVAQTDGAPLMEVARRLTGEDPRGAFGRLTAVGRQLGFSVEDAELEASVNGDCSHRAHRIRVERRNSPAQRVKTLAHELAHAVLHEHVEDRGRAELEAESVAYVVCQELQIDSSSYSFGYVASWAGDTKVAIDAVRASSDRIQTTATRLLAACETS
jgi:antirestriction protein ArdC